MNNSEKIWKILVWDQDSNQIQIAEVSQKLFLSIMRNDLRYTTLKKGLEQLDNSEIQKIIDYPGEMVFDQFNFDESNNKF